MSGQIALGIDVGGTTFAVGAYDRDGNEKAWQSFNTPAVDKPEPIIDELAAKAKHVAEQVGGEVAGLGIGIPGPVVPEEGFIKQCPNLHALDGVFIVRELNQRLGWPVFLANDAFCATLAELRYGAGRDVENMLMLTLGTGIGGGVAIGNRVLRGPRQIMGEIGHMILVPDGPKCGCGNHGCFEALAGRDGIVDLAQRLIQSGRPSLIMELAGGDQSKIDPKIVADAARQGDEVAREVMERIGFYIGWAICNAIVLCDPDLVVIGGGIAAAGEVLFDPIRRTVAARSLISGFDAGRIVPAELGNKAGAIGAAALVWENLAEG